MKANFIILAAGRGSRFGGRSKVLWDVCGKTLLDYVFDLTGGNSTVLVASQALAEQHTIASRANKIVIQHAPNGTGDAFRIGLAEIDNDSPVFVLLGDSCLVSKNTINQALNKIKDHDVIIGKFTYKEENSYGRVVNNVSNSYKVYEKSDYPDSADFYNAGWACFNPKFLKALNVQHKENGEFYLNEYINISDNCLAIEVHENEAIGINSFEDFIKVKNVMRNKLIEKLFMNGVDFLDPNSIEIMYDTEIDSGSIVESNVVFGKNVRIASNVKIMPFTYLENCTVESNATIGPFAYIRGNTSVMSNSHIGAYCEVKNSHIGKETKIKHMSYLGDVDVGERVNIGAGSIFCNYNGSEKTRTIVQNGAFLGGNTTYVSPVTIASNAYVGAGSVIRKNVDTNHVVFSRGKQVQYLRLNKTRVVSIENDEQGVILTNDKNISLKINLDKSLLFEHDSTKYGFYSLVDSGIVMWKDIEKIRNKDYDVYIINTSIEEKDIINFLKKVRIK